MKKLKFAAIVLLIIGVFGAGGLGLYLTDYYKADETAIQALVSSQSVTMQELDGGYAFVPEKAEAGLVFYPGGKVEYSAYAPLLQAFAQEGILCVLLEMPGNLAVLDMNAADGITERFPEISRWYMGGHSLGGSMAASYAAAHAETFDGVLLLASYSTENLSRSGLKVYSLYGSEDTVLNMENYQQNFRNLPDNAVEYVIAGGNHAQFGSYGEQEGDGVPLITAEKQIAETIANSVSLFGIQKGVE